MDIFANEISNEDYNRYREIIKSKKFICIDGLIGAGKTTLIRLITDIAQKDKQLNVHPIYEPVEMWQETGALDLFYSDIPAKCYEFQSFVYVTRIKKVIQEVLAHPEADIYLLERTVFTDRYIFVEMLSELLGPTRVTMYKTWWDMWNCINPIHINKWVFLDVSLEESMRRIKARSRTEETGITLDYQTRLREKHHEFYQNLLKTPTDKIGGIVEIIPPEIMDQNYITDLALCHKIADIIFSQ